MSPELAVALGAGVGAPARFLLDRAVDGRLARGSGIVLVNLLGCLAAGVLAGVGPSELAVRLVGIGFLGSFTTASTVAWDVLSRRSPALLALHVLPGLALAGIGLVVGRSL